MNTPPRGNLIRMTEGQGAEARETVYAYNSLNHLQSVTDALNRTTTFTTDEPGRIRATELPDNRIITRRYGQRFFASIPDCRNVVAPFHECLQEAERWLGRHG